MPALTKVPEEASEYDRRDQPDNDKEDGEIHPTEKETLVHEYQDRENIENECRSTYDSEKKQKSANDKLVIKNDELEKIVNELSNTSDDKIGSSE